jgi:secreted PhoX family phosphatase
VLDRRDFLRTSSLTVGALALGPSFWRQALADEPVRVAPGPYGPLGAPNAAGIAVPQGFTARTVAAGNQPVGTTGFVFPVAPDGSATYGLPDGGWILVINSEVPQVPQGGASSITFDKDGRITGARRILGGTRMNCAGGKTPWGTWLSCEEVAGGFVFECDPTGVNPAVRRDALGVFTHEAACVDPAGRQVYLTEDIQDVAGLYRFTPDAYPDLARGVLEVATDGGGGLIVWKPVPDPKVAMTAAERTALNIVRFDRGEGIFFDTGIVYVATTDDDRVYAYDTATERLEVLYDGATLANAPLHEVDNLIGHEPSGDLFLAEDADDLQICILTGDRVIAPFLQASGPMHSGSELTGPSFTPAGDRLYFSSQRAGATGMVFEVSGPFRTLTPRATPVVSAMPPAAPPPRPAAGAGAPSGVAPGPGAGGGERPVAFGLRSKPAARLRTVRRGRLVVSADLLAGAATVRLKVRGRTIAVGRARPARAGRVRIALEPTTFRGSLPGRRLAGSLELTQGVRRVSRPIVLTNPAR